MSSVKCRVPNKRVFNSPFAIRRSPFPAGGTLIEILVSIFILALVFTSFGSTFFLGRFTMKKHDTEKKAQNYARQVTEDLSNYVAYQDPDVGGTPGTPVNTAMFPQNGIALDDAQVTADWALKTGVHTMKTASLPSGISFSNYTVTTQADGSKKVDVTVEWNEEMSGK